MQNSILLYAWNIFRLKANKIRLIVIQRPENLVLLLHLLLFVCLVSPFPLPLSFIFSFGS